MNIENKIVMVTGSNRGIGKALVAALLKHKAKKVYAAARKISDLKFNDPRVVPIALDITNREQIEKAAAACGDVDVLINNAGVLSYASVVNASQQELMVDMQVNYFGTLSMVNAFTPALSKNAGAIANVVSIVGISSMAGIGGYSASKAALYSATQAMRVELKAKNISVHGIFPGPIDTDMAKGFEMDKTSPEVTAENIIQGIKAGKEYIFPDPMSENLGTLWSKDPMGLEKQFAAM